MAKLFELEIYDGDYEALVRRIMYNKNGKTHVISGNAEVLKVPVRSEHTKKKYQDKRNIIIPDGISVSVPIKLRKNKEIKKITGIDLMEKLLIESEKLGKSIYLLGAKKEVLDSLVDRLKRKYKRLNISGCNDGYINVEDCDDVIKKIRDASPDMLFVAMGTPMQEEFIFKYMDELPCNLFMGVGGSFDVLSGNKKRAPKYVQRMNMEWIYRIFKDPSKVKRVCNNVVFTVNAIIRG